MNLTEFYKDIDDLYAWMDSVYKVSCPPKCNDCCKRDIIWMLTPELVRLNSIAKPKIVKSGCPFQTRTGCLTYKQRPLVCRSYGASQLLMDVKVRMLQVRINNGIQNLAGPGVCTKYLPASECNISELNQIYDCYLSLASKWGLIAVGSCDNPELQTSQIKIMFEMQKYEDRHEIYAKNGVPVLHKEALSFYNSYFNKKGK